MNILHFFNITNVYYFSLVFEQCIHCLILFFFILIKVVKTCKKAAAFLSPGRKTTESPVIIPDSPEHVSYWDLMAFVFQHHIKHYLYDIETAHCLSFQNHFLDLKFLDFTGSDTTHSLIECF